MMRSRNFFVVVVVLVRCNHAVRHRNAIAKKNSMNTAEVRTEKIVHIPSKGLVYSCIYKLCICCYTSRR